MNRLIFIALALTVCLLGALHFDAFGAEPMGEKKKVTVDKEKVYLGSPSNFKKAGAVNLGQIFKQTAPYKQIRREKLDKTDPKYRILIVEANKIAKKAMAKVRDEAGYDLVAEVGHIKVEGEKVPDITQLVIDAL